MPTHYLLALEAKDTGSEFRAEHQLWDAVAPADESRV